MTKRIISFVCVAAMLVSMFSVGISALTIDDVLDANWNALAVKYSTRTRLPITVKDENGVAVPKTEGFEFKATADNGIAIGIPPYATFAGAYGASIITSENKTSIEDLSIDITLDTFDFQQDPLGSANSIGILWTEEPIENVDGISTADATASNGLRHLIPNKSNEFDEYQRGVPAEKAKAEEISGKALYIGITNANPKNAGTQIASNINIVYFDGHYINGNDGHPGYRWTFTSRNGDGPFGDSTDISTNFQKLDLSNGLKVTIKADEKLGYIVNLNGKDYCKGIEVGYFPDALVDGTSHGGFTNEDYEARTEDYLNSMTYAKADINLSGLKTAGEGYLTIGVTGINDNQMVHGTDIVINKINNKPAATWKGEPACTHENGFEWTVTTEPNCGYEGVKSNKCVDCGKVKETEVLPIVGEHVAAEEWTVTVEPNCTYEGEQVKYCTVCGLAAETEAIPVAPDAHNKAFKTTPPTCTEEGVREKYCKTCDAKFPEENETVAANGHSFTNYVVDEGYDCVAGGTETAKCDACDATDTREKVGAGHVAGEWEVTKEPTVKEEGEKIQKCTVCGEIVATEVIEKIPVDFPDVKEDAWYYDAVYYCAGKGYISGTDKGTFNPDGKLTREAFVSILQRFSGEELPTYTESPFIDVKVTDWYAPYVLWAAEKGYVKGVGDGSKFGVGQSMDRQQIATMFFRYAEAAGQDVAGRADLSTYTDGAKVASWAADACAWAVNAGLLKSTSTTALTLAPTMTVTRSQAAQIFMNYDKSLVAE